MVENKQWTFKLPVWKPDLIIEGPDILTAVQKSVPAFLAEVEAQELVITSALLRPLVSTREEGTYSYELVLKGKLSHKEEEFIFLTTDVDEKFDEENPDGVELQFSDVDPLTKAYLEGN